MLRGGAHQQKETPWETTRTSKAKVVSRAKGKVSRVVNLVRSQARAVSSKVANLVKANPARASKASRASLVNKASRARSRAAYNILIG